MKKARVKEQSLQGLLIRHFDNERRSSCNWKAIPALDVMKAEAEVSKRDQDLDGCPHHVCNCRNR